ncbi:MAG TPA: GNAT family N-acetyltransferase [Solirubrobacteraceae bacterium]|jgi:RimJ/RimL family protein N-acetyltransferase|nr:GNAT family N-acetyltransferase [Solirubrobacteraceae bacterium]
MTATPAPRIVLPAEPLVDGDTALRPWRDADLPQLVQACRDQEIVRWTSVPSAYTEADAHSYLRQRYDAAFAGLTAPFAVVQASEDRLLGSISLLRFSWAHARGEVGYWLASWARGQGHATRAVRLICAWGFSALRLERIDLMAATGNPASQGVAERAGFTREAVLRSYMRGALERQDMVMFGLLRGEL